MLMLRAKWNSRYRCRLRYEHQSVTFYGGTMYYHRERHDRYSELSKLEEEDWWNASKKMSEL